MAKLTRYSIYNKWEYSDEDSMGMSARLTGRLIHENRLGGEVDFDPEQHAGTSQVYGQTVGYVQPEFSGRVGYRIDRRHNVALYGGSYFQDQGSWFGVTRYDARQFNAYANLQYELLWNDAHMLKTGFSYRHVDRVERITFSENIVPRTFDGTYLQREYVPGVFAENTFSWLDNQLVMIAGVRADHHNTFGWRVTPRALVKYDFDEKTSVRVSAGTGWRTANIFTENVNLLASSRDVIFSEALRPEAALNFGINASHREEWEDVDLQLSADAYRIQFSNQIFPDYHTDPTQAIISNFGGPAISNGVQAEVRLTLFDQAEIKASYNYLDVYRKIDGEKQVLPFNPRHRAAASVSYSPPSQSWQADANMHWLGRQVLAHSPDHPPEHMVPGESDAFADFGAQFLKKWSKLDLYVGCENIFDFRQLRPIVSWQDPFGPYFDTSNVWGPTRGREFYLGIRFRVE
ncbi:MAG: TonB-dependent receptor [Bacteroidota bacterium]